MINRLWFYYNSTAYTPPIAKLVRLLDYTADAARETLSLLSVKNYCKDCFHSFFGLIKTLEVKDFNDASHVLTLLVKVQYDS